MRATKILFSRPQVFFLLGRNNFLKKFKKFVLNVSQSKNYFITLQRFCVS